MWGISPADIYSLSERPGGHTSLRRNTPTVLLGLIPPPTGLLTLLTLSLFCLAAIPVLCVVLLLIGLPLAILLSLLPWLLRLAAVVLLVKGLLDQPFRLENLLPAAAALLLSVALRWIF